jgi:hypothetical protein
MFDAYCKAIHNLVACIDREREREVKLVLFATQCFSNVLQIFTWPLYKLANEVDV